MIRRVIEAGHRAGIPVSLCGEAGSIPELALLLVAMGIDSLSLIPSAIPETKEAFLQNVILPLRARLEEILGLSEAAAIRERLKEHYRQPSLD
jgi:phosphoenolpyruvate-protein kinase (PTS system EI component)